MNCSPATPDPDLATEENRRELERDIMKPATSLAFPALLVTACLAAPASAAWNWSVNSTLATATSAGPISDSDTNGTTSFVHAINCNSATTYYAPVPGVWADSDSTGVSSIAGGASAFTAYLSAFAGASASGLNASASSHSAMTLTLTTTDAVVVVLSYNGYQPFDGGAYFSLTGPSGTGPAGSTSTLALGPGTHTFGLVAHAATNAFAQLGPEANITANFSVTAVPAPGAAALLGLAGMARRRRR
jgi:MYXO-CTERM domain-containing protein